MTTPTKAELIAEETALNNRINVVNNINSTIASSQQQANHLFEKDLSEIIDQDEKIQMTSRLIHDVQTHQQTQNQMLFYLTAVFWLAIISIPILLLSFTGAYSLKVSLMILIPIWAIGIVWVSYTASKLAPPKLPGGEMATLTEILNTVSPSQVRVSTCPSKCTVRPSTDPTRPNNIPVGGTQVYSEYPTTRDYWNLDFLPSGTSTAQPSTASSGTGQPMYECEWIGNPSDVPESARIITSQYPCHTMPGYRRKLTTEQQEVDRRLRELRKFHV